MSSSFSVSESKSFSVTNAIHMAAKVAADLKRMQRFYDEPSDDEIDKYEREIIALLKAGYLGVMTLGFKKDNQWIEPTLEYTAHDLAGIAANDDDPGRIKPGANINGAAFTSFLSYSPAWDLLTDGQKDSFKKTLPHYRSSGTKPSINGYLMVDKTYSSGGKALTRATVRSA